MADEWNVALLKSLCETPGIPGREDRIRDVVREEMTPLVDNVEVDRLGNLIGRKRGNGGPKVMLAAHLDEIGFIIKHIDDQGFIRIHPVGGFDPRVLPAQRVLVHTSSGDQLPGVINMETKPIHLLREEETKPPKVDQLFVDLGLTGDEVKEQVEIGDMVTLDRTVEQVGHNVIGKALDNRLSIFLMLEALRSLGNETPQAEIVAVASTQEEVGLRGVRTAAHQVQPDVGIALDTTLALDIPGASPQDAVTQIGEGVAIKIMDSSHISNTRLVQHLRELARVNDIKHQMEILPRGGTDAGGMQLSREGVTAVTISMPTRYIHTVNEMCSVGDIQAAIALLTAYLRSAHEGNYTPE